MGLLQLRRLRREESAPATDLRRACATSERRVMRRMRVAEHGVMLLLLLWVVLMHGCGLHRLA